eukprot:gene22764-28925_t
MYGNAYSGGTYTGHFENDKRHGDGEMIYNNGDRYSGQWKHNKLNGQGIMRYANSSRYQGSWKDGKRHGVGQFRDLHGTDYPVDEWCKGADSQGRIFVVVVPQVIQLPATLQDLMAASALPGHYTVNRHAPVPTYAPAMTSAHLYRPKYEDTYSVTGQKRKQEFER